MVDSTSNAAPSAAPRMENLEIYHIIASFLDIPNLIKLMRVSSLWYEIAGSVVYRDLTFDPDSQLCPPSKHPFQVMGVAPIHGSIPDTTELPSFLDIQDLSKPRRVAKAQLMENCRVLRMTCHDARYPMDDDDIYKSNEEIICGASHLCEDAGRCLRPRTLVLRMSLSSANQNHRLPDGLFSVYAYHDFGFHWGDAQYCPLAKQLTPKKLVVKDTLSVGAIDMNGLPALKSIQTLVIIHPNNVYNTREYRQYWEEDPWEIYDLEPPVNQILIFPDVKDLVCEMSRPANWVAHFAHQLRNVLKYPQIKITIVNVEMGQVFDIPEQMLFPLRISGAIDFRGLLNMWFRCENTSIDGEIQAYELEEMWSRVQFLTKAEYLDRGAKELEGEQEELNW